MFEILDFIIREVSKLHNPELKLKKNENTETHLNRTITKYTSFTNVSKYFKTSTLNVQHNQFSFRRVKLEFQISWMRNLKT